MQRISEGREFHCFEAHLEKERWPKGLVLVLGMRRITVSVEERS